MKPTIQQQTRRVAVWGVLLITGMTQVAQATCNVKISLTRPDSRYEAVSGASPADSEVRDKVTGLIWQRCVVGMVWNGTTCTGTASNLTWQQALDAVRTANPSTVPAATAWRVPNHAELYSLAERACVNPAINTTWFLATPSDWTWSSSPYANGSGSASLVDFYVGLDGYDSKGSTYRVRLVRSGQ
jgi:hypothetical protein